MPEIILENNQDKLAIEDDIRETIERVILKTLEVENCKFDAQVSVTIVDLAEIRRINRDMRNIDSETDVLSFPMLEFDENRNMIEDDYDLDDGKLLLGDIVICAERAKSQAEEYGHSFLREMAFLTVHSMLHLLGYDHMEKEEEKEMFSRQEDILNILGIKRGGV
ncbi:MAG TPA: rRNA maturation RNase YbeY [Clostridiales bacterium]|nr:rRNA maturation RNase YbeY [Clostridiales bacterium]